MFEFGAFSPPVPDLTKDGFILIGGRLEVIHQQPAAAIVYRRRQHVVSLYVSPSPGADAKNSASSVVIICSTGYKTT